MPQQSRIFHPELLLKKYLQNHWQNPVMEKLAMETHRKEGKKRKSGVAGTLLFIVQYFTESTKASSVLTRIVL